MTDQNPNLMPAAPQGAKPIEIQLLEILWILKGQDGNGGVLGELKELKEQNAEMYGVFKVLKWGVLYLVGPGGILLILSQALEFFRQGQ